MDLQSIERDALSALESSTTLAHVEAVRNQFLGRNDGQLTQILRGLAALPHEQKKQMGQAANVLRSLLEEKISAKQKSFQSEALQSKLNDQKIDPTLPGIQLPRGHSHPILNAIREISSIFASLGFEAVEERDIEPIFTTSTR